MTYTYDDFVTAATNAGLLDQFSDDDLKIAQTNPEYGLSALKLTQDLRNATTTEQQLLATEALNQLRQSYGSFGTMNTSDALSGSETVYQQALAAAETPAFSYDASQDPSYSALKKSYLREGERAREDTMAQASAMTGGVPSSYAVTAASQAGDYYNTQLADAIPTLEQNAYQRYLNEYNLKYQEEQNALAKQQAAAELMAGVGDYSLYQTLYGLTDEQLAKLQRTYSGSGTGTGTDYSYLELMFPDGVIDATSWTYLTGTMGMTAEQLAALGYTKGVADTTDDTTSTTKKNSSPGGGAQMYTKN